MKFNVNVPFIQSSKWGLLQSEFVNDETVLNFISLTNATFMKPIFTNYGQPLTQTLPDCCGPLARFLSRTPEPKVQQVW